MGDVITYVGIDAHKRELHVTMLIGPAATPVTWTVENEPKAIERMHRIAGERDPRVTFTDQKAAIAVAIGVGGKATAARCMGPADRTGDDLDSPRRPRVSSGHLSADRRLPSAITRGRAGRPSPAGAVRPNVAP